MPSAGHILLIDDEEKLRQLLARVLTLEGFEVTQAMDGRSGLRQIAQQAFDAVLCDVRLPDANGLALARDIKARQPATELILLTAFGNIPDGVEAMRAGAFDYIRKGDDNDKIIPALHKAVASTRHKRAAANKPGAADKPSFDQIVGASDALMAAVALARKVAPTDVAVLLLGETGTGKEVFAQAIHHGSPRAAKPFVAVNCSAISRDLLENELFGHKAGAFTGATKETKGLFEEADGGTIFLDEIGEMAYELQAKLLRVLESGELIKVGGTQPQRVDVRVIAATNKELAQAVDQGAFRADLYYRLNVFQLRLPPLRERLEDLGALVEYFAGRFAARAGRVVKGVETEFIAQLRGHAWKGNLRELRNVVERAVILSEREVLGVEVLPLELQDGAGGAGRTAGGASSGALDLPTVEREHIQKVLRHTGGNKTEAARLLGISISTLYRKLEEYSL